MKPILVAVTSCLGAALMAGCTERNAQTEPTGPATGPFSAGVAAGNSSVILDQAGDAAINKGAQDYQDIVRVEITKVGTNFVFTMDLAAPVPDNPPVPSWADLIQWEFFLDTDQRCAMGYPFTKNTVSCFEFQVEHRVYRSGFSDPYDRTSSAGILVDRRPLFDGGQVIITPIQFTIEGARLTWVVNAASLGDPSTFKWGSDVPAASAGDDVKNGYNNITVFDFAPDLNLGAAWATWPQ
jgi:hypothetical protein